MRLLTERLLRFWMLAVACVVLAGAAHAKRVVVAPGTDTLQEAIYRSAPGDTLVLQSEGHYHASRAITVPATHALVIRSDGEGDRPRITGDGNRLFQPEQDLTLIGVFLDGRSRSHYAIRAIADEPIDLVIDDCEVAYFQKDGVTDDDRYVASCIVRNSILHDIAMTAVEFRTADAVGQVVVENSTFYRIGEHAVHVHGFQRPIQVRVANATIYDCLGGLYLNRIQSVTVLRNIIAGCSTYAARFIPSPIIESTYRIEDIVSFDNGADFEFEHESVPSILTDDPKFFDPEVGDFSLLPSSPYLGRGSGPPVGDTRWVGAASSAAYRRHLFRTLTVYGGAGAAVAGFVLVVVLITRTVTRRREQIRATEAARLQLEERVRERTEDLYQTNQALKEEINARKKTEEELRASEVRYRQLVEMSPDIITVHCEERVTFINTPGAIRLGAEHPDAIIGMDAWELMHPDYVKFIKRRLDKIHLFRKPPVAEVKLVGITGEVIDVEISAVPLMYEGRPAIQVMSRDITERKRAEDARKKAEDRLEAQRTLSMRSDRLRSLGEMAAGIAHELNQPLMAVRGAAEHTLIAVEEGWDASAERVRKRLNQIVGQTDRMVHIIEHVRMFAREAGEAEASDVRINDVVTSTVDLLGGQLRSHDVDLHCDLADTVPLIRANPFSLEEVLMNLIKNARDAAEDRSNQADRATVQLVTRSERHGDGDVVIVEVMDNGDGIPEDIRSRIWDPFFTTKDPDQGTGLGLAISKSIVEEFGGSLQIDALPESGTVARVVIPAAVVPVEKRKSA